MLRAAVLVLTLVVAGAALWFLAQPPAPAGAADKMADGADSKSKKDARTKSGTSSRPRADTPGLAALVNRPVPKPHAAGSVEPPAVLDDPGIPKSQIEVVSRFESFLADLDGIQQAAPNMSREDKERMYVESSNMLAALTEQFDMTDPDQARYVEEARGLMLAQLKALGVGPAVPQMRPTRPARVPLQ